jgi:DNA-directed RNA polymerase specialized sigma24 family protein
LTRDDAAAARLADYDRFHQRLVAFACAHGARYRGRKNAEPGDLQADDLANEAIARFLAKPEKFKGRSDLLTYLCSIVLNCLRDQLKEHCRRHHEQQIGNAYLAIQAAAHQADDESDVPAPIAAALEEASAREGAPARKLRRGYVGGRGRRPTTRPKAHKAIDKQRLFRGLRSVLPDPAAMDADPFTNVALAELRGQLGQEMTRLAGHIPGHPRRVPSAQRRWRDGGADRQGGRPPTHHAAEPRREGPSRPQQVAPCASAMGRVGLSESFVRFAPGRRRTSWRR